MYLALHALKRGLVAPGLENVCVPHGAETGFDPYQAYANLDGESVYGYLHGHMLPRESPGEWVRYFFTHMPSATPVLVGSMPCVPVYLKDYVVCVCMSLAYCVY